MPRAMLVNQLVESMPVDYRAAVLEEVGAEHLDKLGVFLEDQRARGAVYPPQGEVFAALERTPLDKVNVVLLGQDPYHGEGEAHGLSFSVKPGVRVPPTLSNMFKELEADLGVDRPNHGCLEDWADQGVLLLNTALTVEKDKAGSHRGQGWEEVTTAILNKINEKNERVVFLLLGNDARKKASLVDTSKHVVISTAHPSPFSARHGFTGSRIYSRVNAALVEAGRDPVDWRISDR